MLCLRVYDIMRQRVEAVVRGSYLCSDFQGLKPEENVWIAAIPNDKFVVSKDTDLHLLVLKRSLLTGSKDRNIHSPFDQTFPASERSGATRSKSFYFDKSAVV